MPLPLMQSFGFCLPRRGADTAAEAGRPRSCIHWSRSACAAFATSSTEASRLSDGFTLASERPRAASCEEVTQSRVSASSAATDCSCRIGLDERWLFNDSVRNEPWLESGPFSSAHLRSTHSCSSSGVSELDDAQCEGGLS